MSLHEPAPLYVDKLLVPARVMLPGPEHIDGSFALLPVSSHRHGPETLLDVLCGSARVVPFIRSDDVVLLLARQAIEWVEVGSGVEAARVRAVMFMITREEHVQVRMLDGRKIEGMVSMELPDHLNRISDYLNQAEDFFLLATRSGTLLINKTRIAGMRLFESSPKPVGDEAS